MTDLQTIQLWPRGTSVTYERNEHGEIVYGESSGPVCKRDVEIEERARRYQDREIFCLDSSLVDDLIRADVDGFSYDDVSNVYPDPSDWTLAQCREYMDDEGHASDIVDISTMDRETCQELLECIGSAVFDDEPIEDLRDAVEEAINGEDIDGLEDAREEVRNNADAAEIYEWYRVSEWLANELEEIGECVLSNHYGSWWGRQCTGQALIMDGTLQRVASRS